MENIPKQHESAEHNPTIAQSSCAPHVGRTRVMAPFALLKKQTEILFWLICCERKIMFSTEKNKLKKTNYKKSEQSLFVSKKNKKPCESFNGHLVICMDDQA